MTHETPNGPATTEVVAQYVAAENMWREITDGDSPPTRREVAAAAMHYVNALDAYVSVLRAIGRQIPHHLDDVANALRAEYGNEPPVPLVA